MDRTTYQLTEQERIELLSWVTACQSAYHIESTPGHRFGFLPSNLEENRSGVVDFVNHVLASRAVAKSSQPYTVIDMGYGKWEVGAGTNAGVPCIAFGKHGTGRVGELVTLEPRQMSAEETHAVITFANADGLAVLQEKVDEVRQIFFCPSPAAGCEVNPDHSDQGDQLIGDASDGCGQPVGNDDEDA